MRARFGVSAGVLVASVLGACGGGKDNKITVPAVAPIVRAAIPEGLRPTVVARWVAPLRDLLTVLSPFGAAHAQTPPTIDEAILGFFKDSFQGRGGKLVEGRINSSVEQLDERVEQTLPMVVDQPCYQAAATTHRINLSAISSTLDLTVDVQCTQLFDGSSSTNGAGIVYGSRKVAATSASPDDYSLWLNVDGKGMAFVANVNDANSVSKSVDFMAADPQVNRVGAYRVRAQPSSNSFELACAGGCSGADAQGVLDCGFQMVSDGNFIRASGKYSTMHDCPAATQFDNCYDAKTFAPAASASSCAALQFTFAPISSTALAGTNSQIAAAFALASATQP